MRKRSFKLLALFTAVSLALSSLAAAESRYSLDNQGKGFVDLQKASPWAVEYILQAKEMGIMSGDDDGEFRPQDRITRKEVAAVLVKTLKLNTKVIRSSSFSDVPTKDWAQRYVEAVYKAGLMKGNANGKFLPDAYITREELAVIVIRALKLDPTGRGANLKVDDRDQVSVWARDFVQAAMEEGLMEGDGTRFYPQRQAKREDIAVIFVKMKLRMEGKLPDDSKNPTADKTPPTVTIPAETGYHNSAGRLTLTFSEPLYLNGKVLANGTDVTRYFSYGGSAGKLLSATYYTSGNMITILFNDAENGKYVTALSGFSDAAGNAYVPQMMYYSARDGKWSLQQVSSDVTPPTASIPASIDYYTNSAARLVFTFSEPLYVNGTALTNGQSVKSYFSYNGTSSYFTDAVYSTAGNTITLTFSGAENGKSIIVAANAFKDQAGNAYVPQLVTFVSTQGKWVMGNVDVTPPVSSIPAYYDGNNNSPYRLVYTFSEPLYISGRALTNGENVKAYFTYSGTAANFTGATYYTSGNQIVLTFSAAENGMVITPSWLFTDQMGNAYVPRSATYQSAYSRWVDGVLDSTPPVGVINSYTDVNTNSAQRLVVTFAEPLYLYSSQISNGSNLITYFTYNGTPSVYTGATYALSGSGSTITFTFTGAEDGKTITLNTANVIRDAAGNVYAAQTFTYSSSLQRWVLGTLNTIPTATLSTTNNGPNGFSLVFSEPMYVYGGAIPNGSDVKWLFPYDGDPAKYTSATYNASNYTVTFVFNGAENGKKITPSNLLKDQTGNAYTPDVFSFNASMNKWVSSSMDITAPSGTIPSPGTNNSASRLVITFSEPLYVYGNALPDGADVKPFFAFSGSAAAYTSATYQASARTVTLVFNTAANGDRITPSNLLKDAVGNAYVPKIMQFNSGSWSELDTVAPTATVTAATLLAGQDVTTAQSTEAGWVYLVNTTSTVTDQVSLEALVTAGQAAKAPVAANTPGTVGTSGLPAGTYKVYAVDASGNVSAASSGTITLVASPAITSAMYDASTGQLVLTGTNLRAVSGANNDVTAGKLVIRVGNEAYRLTNTANVEIQNSTTVQVTLSATDQARVNHMMNEDGADSMSLDVYYLDADSDWNGSGSLAATGKPITVSNRGPAVTGAVFDRTTDTVTLYGTGFNTTGVASDFALDKISIGGFSLNGATFVSANSGQLVVSVTNGSPLDSMSGTVSLDLQPGWNGPSSQGQSAPRFVTIIN